MASIASIDEYVKRIADGFYAVEPVYGELATAATAIQGAGVIWHRVFSYTVPTLESGVTAYIPAGINLCSSTVSETLVLAKCIDLGSLSLATPTFTDGVAMPTVTELGVSRVVPGAVMMEVTTAFNALPGSFTVTYVDQDGNAAEATASTAMTASVSLKSCQYLRLNTPDWGVQDITAAGRTGGTTPTGVIQFWGLIPIAVMDVVSYLTGSNPGFANLLIDQIGHHKLAAGDVVKGFINSGVVQAQVGHMTMVGDT